MRRSDTPTLSLNDLIFHVLSQVSKACTSICSWVRAMHKYHFVAKAVAPKREALARAQAELAETQAILDAAKARLVSNNNVLHCELSARPSMVP